METRETSILFDQKRIEKAILRAAEIAKDINEMITDGSIFDLFINFLAQKIIQNEQSGQVALTNIGKILRRKNEKRQFIDKWKPIFEERILILHARLHSGPQTPVE